jgi:hypothetical protein
LAAAAILRRAHAVLTRAVALDARSAPALATLANAEIGIGGDLARAVDLMRQAVALAPSRFEYRLGLAEALLRAGRQDEAAELLRLLAARTANPQISAKAAEMLITIDGTNSAHQASVRRLALRIVRDGERQVLGRFMRLDCASRVPQFHVETDAGLLRFDQMLGGAQVITYGSGPASFGCGAVPDQPRVLATFQTTPSGDGDGLVVAIEILPDGYEP